MLSSVLHTPRAVIRKDYLPSAVKISVLDGKLDQAPLEVLLVLKAHKFSKKFPSF